MDDETTTSKQKKRQRKDQSLATISVEERFHVEPSKPLPQYDMPPALAYACSDINNPKNQCIALVCDPKMPLRLGNIQDYMEINHAGLQKIYHFGNIEWAPEERGCPLLIVESPRGERLFSSLDTTIEPLDEEDALIRFMRPAVRYVTIMRDHNFTHRAIRPTNLFYGDKNRTKIILGEPISSLPAVNQPIVCEPVESGLAMPAGRGHGTFSDDIYALAVTYMSLLTGKLPCHSMTDQDILNSKMSIGSFKTIVGDLEFSRMAFELFHGCFEDRPSARWRSEELTEWLSGKHFSLRMHPVPSKSTNPFTIGTKEYFNPRMLAQGITENWKDSKEPIVNGDLDIWIRRYIHDSEFSINLGKAKTGMNPDVNVNHDKTLFRSIVALDPKGPLRSPHVSSMVDGFGGILAFYKGNENIEQSVLQIIGSDLISFWTEIYPDSLAPFQKDINSIEGTRREHRTTRIGGGIENARYYLNPGLNCLSPILDNHYVFNITSLLQALENIAQKQPKKLIERLIDREIAAFIINRAQRDMRSDLQNIDSALDPDQARFQQLKVLSSLQDITHTKELPALCKAAANFLKPTFDRLFGQQNRERLHRRTLSVAQLGSLNEVLSTAIDSNEVENDLTGFEIAKIEFKQVSRSIERLEKLIRNRSEEAKTTGGRVASGISGICGCIITITIIFYIELL